MEEEWRDIKGFEGLYQVSSLGNVRCLSDKGHYKAREMKKTTTTTGYYQVQLYKGGKSKLVFVHRLVADTFIPNPESKPNIDHINTITTDNRVENLRHCTQAENLSNPISYERRMRRVREVNAQHFGINSGKHRPVFQYGLDGIFIRKWETMTDAWKALGMDSSGITRAARGEIKTAGGFQWRYEYVEFLGKVSSISRRIIQFTIDNRFVKEWDSVTDAAKYYKTTTGRICACLNEHTRTCKGFVWRYKETD